MKIPKNFRLNSRVIDELDELKAATDHEYTMLIEDAIDYVFEQYQLMLQGKKYNKNAVEEILGRRIKKPINNVVELKLVNTL